MNGMNDTLKPGDGPSPAPLSSASVEASVLETITCRIDEERLIDDDESWLEMDGALLQVGSAKYGSHYFRVSLTPITSEEYFAVAAAKLNIIEPHDPALAVWTPKLSVNQPAWAYFGTPPTLVVVKEVPKSPTERYKVQVNPDGPVLDWIEEGKLEPLPKAAEMLPRWDVHVIGPDDIYPHDSELEALRHANGMNSLIAHERAKHANDPNYPFAIALVQEQQSALPLKPEDDPDAPYMD
jgi:hypothetical protein